METETIFSASHPWLLAEGIEDGKPTLFRGRQIPSRFIGTSLLPNIFIITVPFDVTDSTKLPTHSQYTVIDEFEARCIDHIEACQLGIVAFIKTFDGFVRYFFYVTDVDAVSTALTDVNATQVRFELAAGHDPDWGEYRAFLNGVRHA